MEEDIKHLEKRIDLNRQMYLEFGRLLSLDEETVNAIENLINKNKELEKENEELKEYNMTYKRILGLADNRIYRKKYLEERRKEQPNLLYPDSDEIYRRYYELKQENEKLKTKLLNILEAQKVIKVETLSYIKENYITIQKIKNKIELLEEKAKNEQNAQVLVQLYKQIKVLHELLDESEENKCGTN